MNTHNTIEPDRATDTPLRGWQWLRKPALIVILVGVFGALQINVETVATSLSGVKFPSLWGCLMLLVGGVVLLVISATATDVRRQHVGGIPQRKHWRSL